MSTPELPPLPEPAIKKAPPQANAFAFGYHADQMREMYHAGRLAGLEEAAEACWPTAPEIKRWSEAETNEMRDAEDRARRLGRGHYETMFAIGAAALKHCASAIRSLKEKQG
jgi:hypothetical protein